MALPFINDPVAGLSERPCGFVKLFSRFAVRDSCGYVGETTAAPMPPATVLLKDCFPIRS